MKRAIIPFVLALAAVASASFLLTTDKNPAPENARPDDLRENGAL